MDSPGFLLCREEGDRDTLALLNEGLALVMADGTYRTPRQVVRCSGTAVSSRIVIGGDHNYPPYEYLDENGRPAGYNVELTRAIAQEVASTSRFASSLGRKFDSN